MELSVHQDKIVSSFARWKTGEASRASDAGEMREEIGAFIELTGLNKKAMSFVRMLDKQEPDKRDDIIRSLTPLLSLMENVWGGQKTPDMFVDADGHGDSVEADVDDFDKALDEAAE